MRFSNWNLKRKNMVDLLEQLGIRDNRVLKAMETVERHLFIPDGYRIGSDPYGNHPCSIGHGQTISQPFIVAYMIEKMKLVIGEKILEIGTGSGYEAAVLDEMGVDVFTIEIVPELACHARGVLGNRVHIREGDGFSGWPEMSPFDSVIVSCAPEDIPQSLIEQLKEGGRMILPIGKFSQCLVILEKTAGRILIKEDLPVRFVPMVQGRKTTL